MIFWRKPALQLRSQVVVIIGMHRSGTSLLTKILHRLGLNLGQHLLIEERPDNIYGYWEHNRISQIQDYLLAELGRTWNKPRGVLPLPKGWRHSAPVAAAKRLLIQILDGEIRSSNGATWGFKDPRTVRLLPMWEDIFHECELQPIYVLAVRSPSAVAASLNKRDGISTSHAEFLWLQHNIDAFRYVGDNIAAIIPYDKWFDRPIGTLHALQKAIGGNPVSYDFLKECTTVIDLGARHHTSIRRCENPVTQQMYASITRRAPRAPSMRRLSTIIWNYDRSCEMLASWGHLLETTARADSIPESYWQ